MGNVYNRQEKWASLPLLATTSGQRHFSLPCASSDSEEEMQPDNSLKLWSLASYTPSSPSLTNS